MEKTSALPTGAVRPITFSYQNQNTINRGDRSFNKNVIVGNNIAKQEDAAAAKERK